MKHRGNGFKGGNVTLIDKNKPSSEHARIFDNARAVGRYVICEMQAAESTQGGIIVPDSVKQGLAYKVRSVGPKVADTCGLEIEEGDRVVFQGGMHLTLGKTELHMVDAASIICVLDRESAGKFFDREDAPALIATFNGEAS